MKTTTQEWLNFAKADLISCEKMLDDDFLSNIVAFHAQQAVEKCFKAIIEENNLTIPHIHNLIRLYNLIEPFLKHEIDKRELMTLDNVYTASRYPSDFGLIETGKPTQIEAKELYECASKIFEMITNFLL